MSFDADAHRRASAEAWEEAAAGWVRRQEGVRRFGAPVSQLMIERLAPQPGQQLLELAAGLGETGMLAAELVQPGGEVIISDRSEAMLAGARERAEELELSNVEFKVIDAEWIDLPLASVDGVLCRWGYMLMADPAAALADTRRVLRPGGRLALAVWDSLERNPWAGVPGQELASRGLSAPPPNPGEWQPGPFALGDEGRVRTMLEDAGFTEVSIEAVDLPRVHQDFDDFFQTTLDLSRVFHDAVLSRPEPEIEEIRTSLAERLSPFTAQDGELRVPGRTLVAAATA